MSLTFTACIKGTECVLTRNANIHGFTSLEELTILFLWKEIVYWIKYWIFFLYMLPHSLTCYCTIFLAGKHSNIGPVPLEVIPSFYRNFLNFSWDLWILNHSSLWRAVFISEIWLPKASSCLCPRAPRILHISGWWMMSFEICACERCCSWKLLWKYWPFTLDGSSHCWESGEGAAIGMPHAGLSSATRGTMECPTLAGGAALSFPTSCHLPERWGNFMKNSVSSPPHLLEEVLSVSTTKF